MLGSGGLFLLEGSMKAAGVWRGTREELMWYDMSIWGGWRWGWRDGERRGMRLLLKCKLVRVLL